MKTKTKIKILALLSAIAIFMLSLLGLGVSLRAFADDGEFPDPDENLTSLYYFSDYYESEEYFYNGFLRDYIDWNPYITDAYLYYSGNDTSFWDQIMQMMTSGDMDIENAFIIFEVRRSLSIEPGSFTWPVTEEQIYEHYENSVYSALESLFRTWKESECKIMFISGTDEVWYEQYPMNRFLEYVDIHINTDLLTPFTYSLTHISCTKYNFEDGVIILDSTMCGDWYFHRFLLPYIVSEYLEMGITLNINPPIMEYDDYDDLNVVQSILNALNLTVYFYDNNSGEYRDMYGGSVGAEVEPTVYNGGYLCIVGGNESLSDETLWNLYQGKGDNAEFFVYNLAWKTVEEVPGGIKYCGLSTQRFNYYLSAIMRDFILNDLPSLQKYNNWIGYCSVTFKPIFPGDGWLVGAEAFVLPEIE